MSLELAALPFLARALLKHEQSSSFLLGLFVLNDERADVVAGLLVVLVVGAVAVGKVLGAPAAAVALFVSEVFNVLGVDAFRVRLVDCQVHLGTLFSKA